MERQNTDLARALERFAEAIDNLGKSIERTFERSAREQQRAVREGIREGMRSRDHATAQRSRAGR